MAVNKKENNLLTDVQKQALSSVLKGIEIAQQKGALTLEEAAVLFHSKKMLLPLIEGLE